MAEIFEFYVNDNRTITFKLSEPIMLEDNGVSDWRFHIPNVVNGLDATGWQWWLVYVNARNDKYTVPLTLEYDYDRPDAYSIATYTVDYGMSCKVGNVRFSLEAIDADTGGTILHEWHTKTYSTNVVDTLQGNQVEYAETESDIISALLIEVRNRTNQLIGGATPTPVSAVSEMLDTDKLYLLTTDGEWYYYNGTRFVPGGVYGAGVVDSVPTQGSTNAVSSGGVYSALHDTDTTLSQSGQAADAKAVSYLLEYTENIFNLDDFLPYGWERTENEAFGALSALSGSKFLDGYAFEAETAYTLSLEAYNTGNVSADTNNGLRIRIYYTDETYALLTVKNNTTSYRFGALITDPAKTVDYINIGYSNSGGNVWHIRNIMLAEGAQIAPYTAYRSCVDTVARNKADITQDVKDNYVWDDLTPTLANGWVLDGVGTSVRDSNGQLVKYAVTAGQVLWLNIGKYAGGVYQFQDSASVNGTGSINPSIIGRPCVNAINGVVIVPDGATHLIASQAVSDPACSVKVAQLPKVLPAYWEKYINTKAREISRQASPPVGNGTRFAFITDVHLRNANGTFRNAGYSPLLMRYLHEHCNIGLAFFGGDALTGSYASLDNAVDDLMLFRDTFSSVWDWMHCVFGNHEYGNNESSLSAMDKSILYNALNRDKERDYTAVNPVYGSYILDNAAEKIRFICLNLNEGNNLTQQNDFFCGALRDTPSGWTIIFITHFTLENDGGTVKISAKLTNTNSIIPAIEAYNARQVYGNYDFTTAGAEVACVIGGHTHWDGMVKTSGGVPVIAVACDMHTGITGMTEGTITEQCFDVFTIDTSAKTISTKRIGYGADRSFAYGA